MTTKHAITTWFKKNGDAGLVLPDGWYGRPFDNVYRLASVIELGRDLDLSLDGQSLILRFTDLLNVQTDGGDLVLGPFSELAVVSQSAPTRIYTAGEVRLKAF